MSSHREQDASGQPGLNRRSFLQTSGGMAAGVAVTVVPSAALVLAAPASAEESGLGKRVDPDGDVPEDTVMAYVRDVQKGHVTIVAGTHEMTYRDPVLTKRLVDAARAQQA